MASKLVEKFLDKDGLDALEKWARSGLTNEQIAHNCGVGRLTLYKWAKQYPAIKEALEKGKAVVNYEVENALYKSAIGYHVEETIEDSTGGVKKTTKYIPPNVVAQIFWLKNRMPDKWRDKVNTEVTGALPIVIKDDIKE